MSKPKITRVDKYGKCLFCGRPVKTRIYDYRAKSYFPACRTHIKTLFEEGLAVEYVLDKVRMMAGYSKIDTKEVPLNRDCYTVEQDGE